MTSLPLAIITGAGRGIGRAVACALSKNGYRVALIARDETELEATAQECRNHHSDTPDAAVVFPLDVVDQAAVTSCVEKLLNDYGEVDLLFNNAGMFVEGTSDIDSKEFERMIDVNLKGCFYFLQAVIPSMKKRRSGYIFNLSSYVGVEALPGIGAYSATKFALNALSQSLFKELVPLGIGVTAICPSWVNTVMAQSAPLADEDKIQPEDIADTVLYLLQLRRGAAIEKIVISCRAAIEGT
ncbi:MAG: SDR family oxidoreductase [Bdellovibrionales bacterium]|nr:SDR family oxidoreductase [Bdellovibrionales bacterium]